MIGTSIYRALRAWAPRAAEPGGVGGYGSGEVSRAACAQGEALVQGAAHVSWRGEPFDHAEGAELVVGRHGSCRGGDECGHALERPLGGCHTHTLGGGGVGGVLGGGGRGGGAAVEEAVRGREWREGDRALRKGDTSSVGHPLGMTNIGLGPGPHLRPRRASGLYLCLALLRAQRQRRQGAWVEETVGGERGEERRRELDAIVATRCPR